MKEAKLSNQVKLLRLQHGDITQAQLAKAVGVTRQTILAIEGNKYSPSLDLAFRIAKYFDEPLESVFQYED